MTRLVVKSHRPLQFAAAVITLSALMAALTWLLLDQSHWALIRSRIAEGREHKLLWEANRTLEEENGRLREQVLRLERTTDLDTRTTGMLQEEIRQLQEEVFRLRTELKFYQGIMEAAGDAKGLDVHDIHVRRLSPPRTYRLKLILTNVTETGGKDAEGQVGVSIEGIEKGATRVFPLSEVALDRTLDMSFKFRNFKRFESTVRLPEGFSPQRVFVELQPKDPKQSKIRKVFDWPPMASRRGANVG